MLTIVAGLPGAGKSVWALGEPGYTVSSDEIRERLGHPHHDIVRAHFMQEVDGALEFGRDVIADATNLTLKWRDRLRAIAAVREVPVRLVMFANVTQALEANLRRGDPVPAEAMVCFLGRHDETMRALNGPEYQLYDEVRMILKRPGRERAS